MSKGMNSRRILFGVTAPNTALTFLSGQLRYLTDDGWDVHLTCSDNASGDVSTMAKLEGATFHEVSLTRNPSLLSDIQSLSSIATVVRRVRPSVVVAGTPKASFLLLASAVVLRVPHRIYLCHGLRFEGFGGVRRHALIALERLLVQLSSKTVAVSRSVRAGLVRAGVSRGKVLVLGAGSPNGVDLKRFYVPTDEEARNARQRFGLDAGTPVAAFVGRLTGDKGISTLLRCAEDLAKVQFLLAGSEEPTSATDAEVIRRLGQRANVQLLGRVDDIETVYGAADVLLLPTRREGMPTVVLEAAAMGRPTVATYATGTTDAVVDDSTGLLIAPDDDRGFSDAVDQLLTDGHRRTRMAQAARDRTVGLFDPQKVWEEWRTFLNGVTDHSRISTIDRPRLDSS